MFSKKIQGFTLIELIVVIGIVAILMTIVIIAVNPARQFGQARNTDRRNAVLAILNAVHQYSAENNGVLPPTVSAVAAGTIQPICNGAGAAGSCDAGETDLQILVSSGYLTALPKDPGGTGLTPGDDENTQYLISRDASNRVTVTANNEEAGVANNGITVTR